MSLLVVRQPALAASASSAARAAGSPGATTGSGTSPSSMPSAAALGIRPLRSADGSGGSASGARCTGRRSTPPIARWNGENTV